MIRDTAHAGLCSANVLLEELEQQLAACIAAYLGSLAEVEKVRAEEFLERAQAAASDSWARTSGFRDGSWPVIPRPHPEGGLQAATEDDSPTTQGEGGAAARRGQTTAIHLQKELFSLQDRSRLRQLEATLEIQGNWPQLERVRELQHKEVSHKWISHLDTRNGAVLAAADFVLNVQKRLGACMHASGLSCRLCGRHLDPQVEHSETCSVAEATKGHYACVRALDNGFRLADSRSLHHH